MYEMRFAVPMSGAVLNNINLRLDACTISVLLHHSNSKLIFVDPLSHLLIPQSPIPNPPCQVHQWRSPNPSRTYVGASISDPDCRNPRLALSPTIPPVSSDMDPALKRSTLSPLMPRSQAPFVDVRLVNLGNTRFMNVVLQCLTHMVPLLEKLIMCCHTSPCHAFYEDLFQELSKYGEIESLNIYDNLADHMVGNVYVQFREDEHAATTLSNLTGRFYADFCEATCRQYEENTCNRGIVTGAIWEIQAEPQSC